LPTLEQLIATAEHLCEQQQRLLDDLRAFQAGGIINEEEAAFKRPDGRLTQKGLAELYAGFEANRSSSALAREIGMSLSAVLTRRAQWQASKDK
jgi:hypothetical protein